MEQILTVLAGQPNCGKSTIFNMLTGARQYVANYPGVTVEKKAGSFVCGDTRVELVDLPGTYSLASWSPEEMAARQFIVEEDPAQIVAVLDASTLEKSLYLCLQLLEMRRPTLAVLNMMDVAAKRGIRVDADALSQALGIPVYYVFAGHTVSYDNIKNQTAALTSATNDWGAYYTYAFNCLLSGEEIATDWCKGYDDNAVGITELGESCAEGTAEKVAEVEAALKDGSLHVFDTSKFTVDGKEVTSCPVDLTYYDFSTGSPVAVYQGETKEAISDGYFHESDAQFRSAPYFDVQIDGITLLNSKF